ncbi:MAG: DUF4404 family protein [Pirellulaceae bacterium]|nr:DUF4404 family protein [Pirellulaceae bacterium]
MPDSIEKLKAIVRELETELHGLPTLDEQAAEVLQEAIREIQSALLSRQQAAARHGETDLAAEDAETESSGSLTDRLNQAAREFEGSHPTLTGILSRLIDGLGQMGI